MSAEIETVTGLIELRDDFTSQIGLAEAALSNFSKENQESLKAVAEAAGLVTAALSLTVGAVIELGKRGTEVNDVRETLDQFAGSAQNANAVVAQLRAGTKGTVDDFTLAKDAAHLLSAGVSLTADQFGTLGQAALLLQKRGLGDTASQLNLVSDALITGRTRALAAELGVIDLGNAQDNYAKTLGITADQLSDTGKAEANRIQVMALLESATSKAGDSQRTFGEEIKAAQTFVSNFTDDLASAVAASPVFKAGLDAIETALTETFGGDSKNAIDTVTGALEDVAIDATYVANAAIETARVFNIAWSGIKAGVLTVAEVVLTVFNDILAADARLAAAGEKLHIVPPGTAADIKDTVTQIDGMTASLHDQVVESLKGVQGTSDFDKTLDTLGGTVDRVRDAFQNAKTAQDAAAKSTVAFVGPVEQLTNAGKGLAASFDVTKLLAAYDKSYADLLTINAKYNADVIAGSGTTAQAQQADIDATFQKQVDALDRLDPLFSAKYAAYAATAKTATDAINSDWDRVKDMSIEALQQQLEKQINTYNQMSSGVLHFTNDALEAQRKKISDAADALRNLGSVGVQAETQLGNSITKANAALDAQFAKEQAEIKASQALGGSTEITRANLEQNAAYWGIPKDIAFAAAAKGFSFQEILEAWQSGSINTWVPQGPKIPGFKYGGMVDIMTGENGPEVVRVPLGSTVFPHGVIPPTSGSSGGDTYNFYVNGTGQQVYNDFKRRMSKELSLKKQFSVS